MLEKIKSSDGVLVQLLGGATAKDLELVISESHTEGLSCTDVQIGYDKSHGHDDSDWCPVGMFMTRMDIDGGSPEGNFPIVRYVRCCKAIAHLSQ